MHKMNREELIKKWLDHNLNPEEQKAFEGLENYDALIKLSESTGGFKAPDYSADIEYKSLSTKLKSKNQNNWFKPLLKIAAVLFIGLATFYFTSSRNTEVKTDIAQTTSIGLPDASTVNLNAQSTLSYNKKSWSDNREVALKGEAFFKVAKGSKFNVITDDGKVTVLGTEFNVIQRQNYFEVTCFEGLVAVKYNSESVKLKPGKRFVVINGTIKNEIESNNKPSWLAKESTFASRPLQLIINELERQYNVSVDASKVDTNQLFTGSFTHSDIDLALKSITLPLGITYTKSNSVVVLQSE